MKMFKKFMEIIRANLLKADWIKLEVEAYQRLQGEQRYHEEWARLMHSGYKVRNLQPKKLDVCDTLAIVTDDGVLEEYLDGKVVGRSSLLRDSENWGSRNGFN